MKLLSVVIVLYNEFELVKKCIRSVYAERVKEMEIILVDNSSKKGTKTVLKQFPKIQYIKNDENIGFGPAVNIGCKRSQGKYILVLTPDTKVLSNTIKKTLAYMQSHSKVALVGCKIYSHPRKFHQSAFHTYPNLLTHLYEYNILFYKIYRYFLSASHPSMYSEIEHIRELKPKHIIGAYMLIRKAALKDINYFDNSFKIFREETDLCKRLIDQKWEIAFIPVDGLVHFGGGSWKKTTISQALPEYMRSTYFFFKKHHGKSYEIAGWIIGTFSSVISIPFLFYVIIYKSLKKSSTQSTQLLPCWKSIFKWHLTSGIKQVFFNTF